MKVAGEYHFDAPPQKVWEALLDPEVLAAIMPGCKKLELTGENQYEGVLDMKVGPVQGQFQGKVNLDELDEMVTSGLAFFMRSPGPIDAGSAFQQMLETGRRVAERLDDAEAMFARADAMPDVPEGTFVLARERALA